VSPIDDDASFNPPTNPKEMEITDMNGWQCFGLVVSLWPYTLPLFTVYVAEYAVQSGTWTTIGFPVSDAESTRDAFFEYSNWMYQTGVFLS
jgi:CLN3 protein